MPHPLRIEYENEFVQVAHGEKKNQEAPDQANLRVLKLSLNLRPDPDAVQRIEKKLLCLPS